MKLLKSYVIPTLSLVILSACNMLADQDGEGHFVDGKMPETLNVYANPKVSDDVIQKFIQKDKTGRIKVAVIDSGFDYLHPELVNQTHLDIEDGKLVGIGMDFFAKDRFAHANMATPNLYAFTAKDIIEGRIVKDDELEAAGIVPLTLMDNLNTLFMNQLISAIKEHDILKDSLFTKIEGSEFNVFQAAGVIANESNPFNTMTYEKQHNIVKEQFPEGIINKDTKTIEIENKYHPLGINDEELRKILHMPWISHNGFPFVNSVEHFDVFLNVLKEQFASFETSHKIVERMKNYHRFTAAKNAKKYEHNVTSSQLVSIANNLSNKFTSFKNENRSSDSIYSLAYDMCQKMDDEKFAILNNEEAAQSEKTRIVQEYFSKMRDNYKFAVDRNHELSPDELGNQLNKKRMDKHLSIADSILSYYPEEAFYCHNLSKNLSPMKEFYTERYNPYVDSNGTDNSHGTHVAGTILKQSDLIDIVPIKVVTQSIAGTPEKVDQAFQAYAELLENYFSSSKDHVDVAKNKILPFYDALDSELELPEKDQIIAAMLKRTDKNSNFFNFNFVDQIEDSVKYIGENKIKLANISLGWSSQQSPIRMNKTDNLLSGIKFVMFEAFKWKVRMAMESYAKDTLFVIAAGNSSQWIDGFSNQVLPCVLSNPEIALRRDANSLRDMPNILCVGSMAERNGQDWASSFTNIVIDDLPFIFSYGENVFAPIKTTSCRMTDEIYKDRFAASYMVPTPFDNEQSFKFAESKIRAALGKSADDEIDFSDEDVMKKINEVLAEIKQATGVIPNLVGNVGRTRLCHEEKLSMGFMSGTSMASPHSAGYIAAKLAAEMLAAGKTNDEIYSDPAYSPMAIVNKIQADTPTYENTDRVADIHKIVDVKLFELPEFPEFNERGDEFFIPMKEPQMATEDEIEADTSKSTASL